MRKLKALLATVVLMAAAPLASGFVMIGPMTAAEMTSASGIPYNITDDLGGPKELKTFYRWNTPHLTYSFDTTFVQYFGIEGMQAVQEAFRIVNDFFEPEDGSYNGVSELDFAKHGFLSNYNTAWVNTTAQNNQIIDIKSLVLGMIVNQLGVGNPHRYAFTVRNITTNVTGTQWNFNVRLKNYDPISWEPTDRINGVTYSYRLIHDAIPAAGGPLNPPTIVDMEEFTTDTSGNAWTAVSGIVDAFYGNTALYFTETPTLFNFGVYYDGINAMGGQYQPRHALTYDDVGALKYMYRRDNLVYESLPDATTGNPVNLVVPAQLLPNPVAGQFLNPTNSFVSGGTFASINRAPRTFPRRFGGATPPVTPVFGTTSPYQGIPILGQGMGMVDMVLRGGVDKIQFHYVPYDSLMGVNFTQTNYTWVDRFAASVGQTIGGLNNTTPGASAFVGPSKLKYYEQTVGRTVVAPDITFMAALLGQAPDGVPIAWNRNDTNGWVDNFLPNWTNSSNVVPPPVVESGPGTINIPTTGLVWTLARMSEDFELIWNGEASVVGNQDTYTMWGYIKGPGPNDVVTFPQRSMLWRLENEVTPKTSVPTISMISDNGGLTAIATNSYTRTQETISIIGNGMAGATAIEILDGDRVLQTLYPAEKYLVNNQRLDIPPGTLAQETEGSTRQIRVWNTVGPSDKSPQFFNVYTGRAVVTGTSRDKSVFDRAQSLTVYGYGFKSSQTRSADGGAKLSHLRLEDGLGNVVIPTDGNATAVSWEVVSDTEAVLPLNSLTYLADGTYRRIRVSRDAAESTLSATNNVPLISFITTKPSITTLQKVDANGTKTTISTSQPLERDRAIEITGTALNTAIAFEIVKQDGTSFPNPVVINLPNAGVVVDENGTRVQISSNTVPYPDADGHTADQRCKFKFYNSIGNHVTSTTFNVNVQPAFSGYAGFTIPGAFNRHITLGDDITITGTGLQAVTEIQFVDENGTALTGTPNILLPHPGVSVTDTSIAVDTSKVQFNNGTNADSTTSNRYRRFRLVSARDAVMSAQTTRFDVGVPPTYTDLTISGNSSFINYRRDNDSLDVNGTGLGLVTKVEIVDINGNPITGVSSMTTTTGLSNSTVISVRIDANASALTGQGHLIDNAAYLADGNGTRRIRVTTPFGVTTSAAGDGFTISATPGFLPVSAPVSASTFGGSADFNGSDYNATVGTGLLVINGSNFRGVKRIYFGDSSGLYSDANTTYVAIDPNAPPSGVTVNAAGTQITFTKAAVEDVNATWLTTSRTERKLQFRSAADQDTVSPSIWVKE